MSIKRLKPSPEQELIAQIKEGLSGYEEGYVPGAWENFKSKQDKGRGLVFWMTALSGVAAVLLLGFGIFFFVQKEGDLPKDTLHAANSKIADGVVVDEGIKATKPDNEGAIVGHDKENALVKKEAPANLVRLYPGNAESKVDVVDLAIKAHGKSNVIVQSEVESAKNEDKKETKATAITLDEFLANENKRNNANPSKTSKVNAVNKWDLGLIVSPSIGDSKKLNMGYGMSMAYRVSERVSLSSGLSYNEMDASREITDKSLNSPNTSAFVNDSKSLAEVSTRVTGIDIPLEIKYKLSERFYANAGVSAFAVISQKQSNTYQQSRVVQRTALSPTGDSQSQSFLLTEKVTENAAPNTVATSSVVGFYNFSFGYKQKLSKDKSIGIEPFIKIPMKDVSKENLRLMGTGLKIRFDF